MIRRLVTDRWTHTEEEKRKISMAAKGRVFSEEHRRHISEGKKGIRLSEESKKKLSQSCKKSCWWIGERHPLWAGDKVSLMPLHRWVKRRLAKPEVCSRCGQKKKLDLAYKDCSFRATTPYIRGTYKRDLSMWMWVCRKCHMTLDGRLAERANKQATDWMLFKKALKRAKRSLEV